MNILRLKEPTAEQCTANDKIAETDSKVAYAIWYPQMGGYVGRAIAVFEKNEDTCVDVFIWHDGEFPFGDGPPVEIHHCCPEQFVEFGTRLITLMALSQPTLKELQDEADSGYLKGQIEATGE